MDEDVTVRVNQEIAPANAGPGKLGLGSRLGDYRILRLLGRGAMGEVYEAEQERLRQRYALKVLPPDLSSDRDFRQRFEHEAQVLAGLKHPHIVQIHYAGETDGRFYLVMELLPRSLEQVRQVSTTGSGVALRKLEPDYVRTILLQVLDGLIQAHSKGIIHRDLKPANLLMDDEGRMKLADFGVARVIGNELKRTVLARTVAVTLPNAAAAAATVAAVSGGEFVIAGTPAYMAPEVQEGREADVRTDLYAVGVIAYELLTAQRPAGRFPDASSIVAGLDVRWDALINRALEADPAKRWPDGAAMRLAVEALATSAVVAPQKKSRVPGMVAGAIAAACIMAGATWMFLPRNFFTRSETSPQVVAPKGTTPQSPNPTAEPSAAPVSAPPPKSFLGPAVALSPVPAVPQDLPPVVPTVVARTPILPVSGEPWSIPVIALAMVWIPPGEFMMGSPPGELDRDPDEGPQTRVRLTEGFWLGKYEVTQAQWLQVMGSNPSRNRNAGADAPVENISWDDAVSFCVKLTDRERAEGCLPVGWKYALPTEAQWEYASRAGSKGAGPEDINGSAWSLSNGRNTTHPVGKKSANAWGLHDTFGNVWEWCLDSYQAKLPGDTVDNWRGPATGSERVLRGGSVYNDTGFFRFANRFSDAPGNRVHYFGLRLALVPAAK